MAWELWFSEDAQKDSFPIFYFISFHPLCYNTGQFLSHRSDKIHNNDHTSYNNQIQRECHNEKCVYEKNQLKSIEVIFNNPFEI